VVAACVLGGCAEDTVDGFPTEVWEYLLTFRLPDPPTYEVPVGVDRAAAEALGRRLFFDADYSDRDPVQSTPPITRVSCATCHDPALGFADNSASSPGVGFTGRNAPGLTNLAYRIDAGHRLLWNGQEPDLGAVIDVPIESRAAMLTTADALVDRIGDAYDAEYRAAFGDPQAMPGTQAWTDEVYADAKVAFAAYQSRLVTAPSRFDRWLDGDEALTDGELRGVRLFLGFCDGCHGTHNFADGEFHSIGVPQYGEYALAIDHGRAGAADMCGSAPADCPDAVGKFRTPTLRNVALTGPYMHAGQLASLADVLWFYNDGGGITGFVGDKDARMQPIALGAEDLVALEAFLHTLTATVPCELTTASGTCGS
jgi:cytochrome c peroxidase